MSTLKGWVRLGNLRPGAIFKTRAGILAVKGARFYSLHNPQPMCILLATGGDAHFPELDQEWVLEVKVAVAEEAIEEAPCVSR